jgi:hypothetical protein
VNGQISSFTARRSAGIGEPFPLVHKRAGIDPRGRATMAEMPKFLEHLSELEKIPTRIVLIVLISGGLLLAMPDSLLLRLHLNGFMKSYGLWVGFATVFSLVFFLINLGAWAFKKLRGMRRQKAADEGIRHCVEQLDEAEKAVLREFRIQGQNTISLPMNETTVAGLISKRILVRCGGLGSHYIVGPVFPFSLGTIARTMITDDLLGLPAHPTVADAKSLRESRPAFVASIEMEDRHKNAIW